MTAAADVVGRSQSAVSQKVLRLEENLGLQLLERTSRSLSVTPDGERVLVAGRRLLAQYDAFMHELRNPEPLIALFVETLTESSTSALDVTAANR